MSAEAVLVDDRERVWRVTAGAFPSNCYIVGAGATGCAVIDPGLDGDSIRAALASIDLQPHAVLCTHGHFDHAGSAAVLQRTHGCPVYLPKADLKTLRASNFLLMAFGIDARIEMPEAVLVDAARPSIEVGGRSFTFHPAPGHTPGSCIVQTGDSLFTGDTLYARGVGLSKLPGEDPALLRRTLLALWERFPPQAVVHPGHGGSASLGWIQENNDALRRFLESADEVPQRT